MFSLLADTMFAATLARRGSDIPEHPKGHADHYTPQRKRRAAQKHPSLDPALDPYRNLW